ncbi:hypothetical protein QGN29_14365 [Temperatibacter marinus]|uniref:Response regulatory domain-containing protein n=1 Tax=Temperatibacter marinus TaxID=1456591 RepID=A0AA52EDE9_9PROT|nr:hypothetical protein [Temperatibacter marinus]WND02731.1 hypothetical protein QGN29_14365 [Temperatibacter marinus]
MNEMYEKELPAIKALICIGNDHISHPIYEYIKRSGSVKTTIATNSLAAMNELYDEEYHFFLIAQELPDGDGLDLYKKMVDKGFITAQSRCIFLMENPSRNAAIKAAAMGIEHILVPPFSLKAVSDRMKTIYASVLEKPKPLKGVAVMAKNAHMAETLKNQAVEKRKKRGEVSMKIHAPHETADLILKDQKIIRKPRKATAILAKRTENKMYKAEVTKRRAPIAPAQEIPQEAAGKAESGIKPQLKIKEPRPIESLPPYPGMTAAQRERLHTFARVS